MEFTVRWPVLSALRGGVRRFLPGRMGQRKLNMPVLETQRLKLRPFDQKDLKEIVAWGEFTEAQNADAAARDFLDYCFREYRGRGIGPWAIQLKETGAIVGNCGFPDLAFRKLGGEVNYYIASQHRGQGLALEALTALLAFGFGMLGLSRIQARCDPGNQSSERVMQKSGMRFEGFVEPSRSARVSAPKQRLYAILKNDFHMKSKRTVDLSVKMKVQPGEHSEGRESS